MLSGSGGSGGGNQMIDLSSRSPGGQQFKAQVQPLFPATQSPY